MEALLKCLHALSEDLQRVASANPSIVNSALQSTNECISFFGQSSFEPPFVVVRQRMAPRLLRSNTKRLFENTPFDITFEVEQDRSAPACAYRVHFDLLGKDNQDNNHIVHFSFNDVTFQLSPARFFSEQILQVKIAKVSSKNQGPFKIRARIQALPSIDPCSRVPPVDCFLDNLAVLSERLRREKSVSELCGADSVQKLPDLGPRAAERLAQVAIHSIKDLTDKYNATKEDAEILARTLHKPRSSLKADKLFKVLVVAHAVVSGSASSTPSESAGPSNGSTRSSPVALTPTIAIPISSPNTSPDSVVVQTGSQSVDEVLLEPNIDTHVHNTDFLNSSDDFSGSSQSVAEAALEPNNTQIDYTELLNLSDDFSGPVMSDSYNNLCASTYIPSLDINTDTASSDMTTSIISDDFPWHMHPTCCLNDVFDSHPDDKCLSFSRLFNSNTESDNSWQEFLNPDYCN
eukprot:c20210_g1_i3.p1 GENE.c20210_g1_i3~~c20210_g1_i3.p1  ORF type:complete len:462 (+),score=94.92 c20210_g1_i3:155-1540(+)